MQRKVFIHRLIYYFCLITIPVLLLISVFLFYLNRSMRSDIQERTTYNLYQLQDRYELILKNAASQYDVLISNPRLSISLKKLLSNTDTSYTDIVLTNTITANFTSATNNNEYLDSIYYYLDDNPLFLSSEEGIRKIDTVNDKDWLESYQHSDKNVWTEKRHFQQFPYTQSRELVTLYFKLSMYRGVLAVNILPEKFQEALEYQNPGVEENIFIVNENNQVLFLNRNSEELISYHVEEVVNLFDQYSDDENYANTWVTIDSEKYLLNTLPSNYDTRIISLISRSALYQQTEKYVVLNFVIIGFLFFVSILLSYQITKKNFMQINYIVELFANAENGIYENKKPKYVEDEYDTILNNVINLFIKSSFLHSQLALKEEKQKSAEIKALQLQINPHFLFNTLQTLDIKAIEMSGLPSSVNEIIEDLSDILKYSLGNPKTIVRLRDEIQQLRKYDSIQHFRYEDKYILYYEYEEEVADLPFLRLVLQPLVENSLYHGIKPLEGRGYIKVKCFLRGTFLYTSVTDTGVGMTREELHLLRSRIAEEETDRIGLANVNQRLILRYGEESGLNIVSKLNMGTSISFRIPAE